MKPENSLPSSQLPAPAILDDKNLVFITSLYKI